MMIVNYYKLYNCHRNKKKNSKNNKKQIKKVCLIKLISVKDWFI